MPAFLVAAPNAFQKFVGSAQGKGHNRERGIGTQGARKDGIVENREIGDVVGGSVGIHDGRGGICSHAARSNRVREPLKGPQISAARRFPDFPHGSVGVRGHARLVFACREMNAGLGQAAPVAFVGKFR